MRYTACIMDPQTGASGQYDFDSVEGLLTVSPKRIMGVCFSALHRNMGVNTQALFSIDTACKTPDSRVIRIHGDLGETGRGRPYVATISQAD